MKKLRIVLLMLPMGLYGCATVGPALTSLALAFGQDLIAAASANHAPRYAVEVESLLVALASQATGMQFQGQLAASGYQRPPLAVGQQNSGGYQDVYASNNPYGQASNDPYGQSNDPYGQSNNPYGQTNDPYGQSNDPYGQSNDPYGQSNDPYAQNNDPYGQSNDPYAQNNDPYGQQSSDPYAQPDDPYGQTDDPYAQQSGNPYAQQSNDPYAQSSGDPYAQESNDPYAQSGDPYAQESGDPYAQQGNDPYAQQDPYDQQDPYAQPSDDPYAQASSDPYGQADDPYARQPNDPYAQAGVDPNQRRPANAPSGQRDVYARQQERPLRPPEGGRYPVRGLAPIELDVAILAQKAGSHQMVEVEDGDTLVDGGSDPASGDLLKVHFRANCNCYVYVIGVDATGYVAQIYPDAEENHTNPVRAGASYLVPAGGEDWWALDTFKGVEQVYFVAAYTQRNDIEQALGNLAAMPRNVDPATFRPVSTPAIVPATRGLVKVKARPVQVPTGNAAVEVTPTMFSSEQPGNEVVVTRWFHHE